jgi:hypothetical protein
MPSNNPSYWKEYYKKNKEKILAKNNKWVKDHPGYQEEYRKSPEFYKAVSKNHQKVRLEVLCYYSGNPPKCQCCGENHLEFLSIDHVNNDGNVQRKIVKGNMLAWLKRHNFPKGYQVLCHNCNMAKGFYGQCPHLTERLKSNTI